MTKAVPGELLYFYPEDLVILVVMAGDDGIRYIEPMNPQFDIHGGIITTYVPYAALSEWTTSLGTVSNISRGLMVKKSH